MTIQYSIDNMNWLDDYSEGCNNCRWFDGKKYTYGPIVELTLSNGEIHKGLVVNNNFYSNTFGGQFLTK